MRASLIVNIPACPNARHKARRLFAVALNAVVMDYYMGKHF
jgi:hypothetical protein